MKDNNNLIWLDLEMTGLNVETECIIEIATIVTDSNLNILDEGPNLAIWQSDAILSKMDNWNTHQHGQSGLIDRVKNSRISERDAEFQTINFLSKYVDKGLSPMCGNSICLDRRFLIKYMPELAQYFHYRQIDVSSLKELVARWKPKLLKSMEKKSKHLALDDVKDSINELKYYRQHFIVS
jgi:oligoribonuclease